MKVGWDELRRQTGVRTFAELPLERANGLDRTFRPSGTSMTSVRPTLLLSDGVPPDELKHLLAGFLRTGSDVLVARLGDSDNASLASLCGRTEDCLVLARELAHRCAGKTVAVWARGTSVPPAALMLALERPYFSTLTSDAVPPPRAGWPTWEEMAR